jgi:hypothetical protein
MFYQCGATIREMGLCVNCPKLKLSAVNCGESPILKEKIMFPIRSLTPQEATGNALAAGFVSMMLSL